MEDIYKEMDKGIVDVVKLLRENGIETFTSCEGGEGHAFKFPTVRCYFENHEEDEVKIMDILGFHGYRGFYVSTFWACSGKAPDSVNLSQSFIQIEFWTYPVSKE